MELYPRKSSGPSIPVMDGIFPSESPHGHCVKAKGSQKATTKTKSRGRVAIMILSNRFMANIYKP